MTTAAHVSGAGAGMSLDGVILRLGLAKIKFYTWEHVVSSTTTTLTYKYYKRVWDYKLK